MGDLAVTELILNGVRDSLVVESVALQPLEAQAQLVIGSAGDIDGQLDLLLLAVVFVCERGVNLS